MSLLEDCKNAPTTNERGYAVDVQDVVPGAKMIHWEVYDTTRWGYIQRNIIQRGDEYVEVMYEVGSGDSEIDYEPEFAPVQPVSQTTVSYERV